MQIIEAALAFAITMLVLSILCTTLVETIHRIFGMREAGFRKMLGEVYDRVLKPKLNAAAADAAKEKWLFQRRMSVLRSPVGLVAGETTPPYPENFLNVAYDWLATIWRGRGLSELTTTGFMERLGADSAGKGFVTALGGGAAAGANPVIDQALQDVAQKFEAFSKDATTFFQRRARLISVCVAMFVAFALHVDAIDLFGSLLTNTDARAAVLAMQDEALKANKRAEEQAKNPGAPPANLAEVTKLYAETQKKMQETQAKLQDTGASIGWSKKRADDAQLVWKWEPVECTAEGKAPVKPKDGECPEATKREKVLKFGIPMNIQLWVGLLLGGLLIGLGGPFWSDAISSITRVRDAARNITGASPPAAPAAAVAPAAPSGQTSTPQPRTPVDAFKVSHQ